MAVASNYDQFTEMLAACPSIKVLEDSAAQDILDRVMAEYHVNTLHYFWSKPGAPIIARTGMQPRDVPDYYAKARFRPLSGDVYLIIDCRDERFIVCRGHLDSFRDLLRVNYFELVEIYLVDDAFRIRFCMNHDYEAFELA